MMMNLFSTFDPCTGTFSMNWLSSMLIFIVFNYSYWLLKNNVENLFSKIIKTIDLEMFTIFPYKGASLMMTSMFLMILINNIMGLLPYIFTASSHMIFSLSLAMPMWMTLMLYGWINKSNYMFSHTVPIGTPGPLMPFMVIIESISNLIRPGSLAIRLAANMIAGHLLMTLLGSSMNLKLTILFTLMFVMLLLFETAVSIIQSYVFTTLSTLYSSEI